MTIIAITGHRPNKLFGYNLNHPRYQLLADRIMEVFHELGGTEAISGMALGVDQLFALACIAEKIPFTAAVPFKGQESMWPEKSQTEYRLMLKKAARIVEVCDPGYTAQKMRLRNQWMCEQADYLIGVWDYSSGGTANCIQYAGSLVHKGLKPENFVTLIDPKEIL